MSDYVSPALERMAARAKLPISVEYMPEDGTDEPVIHIWRREVGGRRGYFPWGFFETPAEATKAYLILVESLSSPPLSSTRGVPSEAGSAAITGSSPPGGR